jgi:hypothetical protein
MKNTSFFFENEKNEKDISVYQNEEQKRSKSSELLNINFSDIDIYSENNYFDKLQIVEPYITPREQNNICKILSFKNEETKEDINYIIKKEKVKVNENNKKNIYNAPKFQYKKKIENNIKKINKNSSISKILKKNDNNLISKINYNKTKNKIITKNKSSCRYKKKINNFYNIPIKSIKIKHQKYMTNNNSFCIKEKEKEIKKGKGKEKEKEKEKENCNNINFSNSNIENSASTNFNSENINKYSPNITFGNKQSPNLNSIKYRKLPKEFVYIKKINKKNSNGSIINKSKNKSTNIVDYNQFQIELNNIKINDSYDIKNIKCIKKINYEEDEFDNEKERISYVGKYKTFAQIERKNENLNIIKKIINNNLITPFYNSNSNRIKENENKLFLNNSEEQNYNNLKTATFYEIDK